MRLDLQTIAADFAGGIALADQRRPQAVNVRSKIAFQPGIGPHSEASTVELVMRELAGVKPELYSSYALGVRYPTNPRWKCDLCLGTATGWDWSIEIKMARFVGDNGKDNDNILMHILSPYPPHRSALTDCQKLLGSGFSGKRAILIYGFDHKAWPLDPAVEAFETLARAKVKLGDRQTSSFSGLIHPVHTEGRVFAWEIE